MSFQDLERGGGGGRSLQGSRRSSNSSSSDLQAITAGIFKLNTAVSTFNRLVGDLGTAKDSPKLRDQLNNARLQIGQLAKETSAKLKQVCEADQQKDVPSSKKVADAKLVKDFQAVLKEFQKLQQLATEREKIQKVAPKSSQASSEGGLSMIEEDEEYQRLLQQQRQQLIQLDNEIAFNDAIIDERDQGITEIQHQIGEVNDIFRDLAVLVNDQGSIIDDISSSIDNSYSTTAQAKASLLKTSKSQKNRKCLTCWLPLVVLSVIALVVILMYVL